MDAGAIRIVEVAPTSPPAEQALHAYLDDVASRYYGRPATDAELEAALAEHPTDDLVAPHGVFLLAMLDDEVCGCVGLVRVEDQVGEVRRLYVGREHRRLGLGRRLMTEVEHRCRAMGMVELRLDTRRDLVESQRLYASLGYRETPPHSGGPYSDHWYRKRLA
ncbi:GNAT family N-acetyltransferase [Nocardioides sp. SR21]|uniref:GNAT family N-acetyltransferase n=1 Tax=Nocardioides sp. SR21 TaxID=2919501 RepID=UPI001FAA2BB3|nr:GNAT family N-acetyltransferase [Nocardioides sp. SR21]